MSAVGLRFEASDSFRPDEAAAELRALKLSALYAKTRLAAQDSATNLHRALALLDLLREMRPDDPAAIEMAERMVSVERNEFIASALAFEAACAKEEPKARARTKTKR